MRLTHSYRIVSFRGIDLKIHISLIFLVLYVVFITTMQFPLLVQRTQLTADELSYGPGTWGLIFAIALFASVALHEFGHALVGQAMGVRVRGITLMMLGGVSEMSEIPDRPYAEFKLAIVGPLVSLAIAAIFFVTGNNSNSPNYYFFSSWIASTNLVLAIFNLLPAFPLDGGRALRSLLAARQGQIRATRTSVKISRGFAWFLGVVGFLQFNFILMLIAFFIYTMAQSELSMLLSKGLLEGMRVGEVTMRADPVDEGDTLVNAASMMLRLRNSVLPVTTRHGDPALVSLEDIRGTDREERSSTPVSAVMEDAPKFLDIRDSISQALPEILQTSTRALPVKDKDKIVGVIRYADITEILQFRSMDEAAAAGEGRAA